MKKTLLCLLLVFFSLGISAYAADLNEGAYVSFGQYGGEPILWKVVGSDTDGYFLLSDKVICFKPFDALKGDWESSSLRAWLNSAEDTVTYANPPTMGSTQITANPYDAEKGFLNPGNFTDAELGMLTESSRRVVVNDAEKGSEPPANPAVRNHIRDPKTSGDEAANLPSKDITDKIFLPSPADIQHISLSHETFGIEYQIATPTAYAVENAVTAGAKEGKGCYYWLGDALWFSVDPNYVHIMAPYDIISYTRSYNGLVGVRPMCKLGNTQFVVGSGAGSETDPYILNAEGISITAEETLVLAGSKLGVSLFSNLKGEVTYEKYLNGVKCEGDLIAVDGTNVVYYKAFAADGTLLAESNKVTITAFSYQKISDHFFSDFEGSDLLKGLSGVQAPTGYVQGVRVDAAHGISLEAKSANRERFNARLPDLISTDVMAVEFEFMLPATNVIRNNIVSLKIHSNSEWISPIAVENGKFIVEDISSEFKSINIEAGKWYGVKLYFDQSGQTLTVVVTDENGLDHILCYQATYTQPIDYLLCCEFTSSWNASSDMNTIYFDNIYSYHCTQNRGEFNAAASISDSQAEVSVYNPAGETETVTVFGVVYEGEKMVEYKMEKIAFTSAVKVQNISFHFAKKGEIKCIVLDGDLSPVPVRTAQ